MSRVHMTPHMERALLAVGGETTHNANLCIALATAATALPCRTHEPALGAWGLPVPQRGDRDA